MDVGIVSQNTLKPRAPLCWLFYLYIFKLILFALKFSLTQQIVIRVFTYSIVLFFNWFLASSPKMSLILMAQESPKNLLSLSFNHHQKMLYHCYVSFPKVAKKRKSRSFPWKVRKMLPKGPKKKNVCLRTQNIVPVKVLIPTTLDQQYKDKTITYMVHEVLMWFNQPCLHPQMRENHSNIQLRIL